MNLDIIGMKLFMEELIRKFDETERYNILFYSTDKTRDFKITIAKVAEYTARMNKLLAGTNESNSTKENRAGARKEDLQGESV